MYTVSWELARLNKSSSFWSGWILVHVDILPAKFFLCFLWVEIFVFYHGTKCVPFFHRECLKCAISTLSEDVVRGVLCYASLSDALHSKIKQSLHNKSKSLSTPSLRSFQIPMIYFECKTFWGNIHLTII